MREFSEIARLLATQSGDIIKRYFRTPHEVMSKYDKSPVTIADKKAEETMREILMKEFPDHGILGEEFEPHNPDSEYLWVLDPIDGTKNFICGGFAFGTLIALLHQSEPILGVIHQPVLGEFLIGDNTRTELNGVQAHTRNCETLSNAVLLTSDPLTLEEYQNLDKFKKLKDQVSVYRGWGDCYGYLLLATGNVDIVVDPIMNSWDIMALIPIVRGAGGRITDYSGRDPVRGSSIIATSGTIHQQVIAILD